MSEFFVYLKVLLSMRQDQNTAAKICLIAARNGFVNTKKVDLDKLYEESESNISTAVLDLPEYLDEIGGYFCDGDID